MQSTVAKKNSPEGRNLGRNLERNQFLRVASCLLDVAIKQLNHHFEFCKVWKS
jgi:hypothetical protein